jgi:hypothetical protein
MRLRERTLPHCRVVRLCGIENDMADRVKSGRNLGYAGFRLECGDRPSLKPEQICVLQLFLVRQKTFDRFHKCLLNHVAEARLAFDHGFSEFFRLLKRDVWWQRWNFRIGDRFQKLLAATR